MLDRERVRREKVVLRTVYDRMKNRINNHAAMKSKWCVYNIPEFIPGYPLVNVPLAMRYIVKKLIKERFIVNVISENSIFISWDPKEIRRLDSVLRNVENDKKDTGDNIVNKKDDFFIKSLIRSKNNDKI